MVIYQILDNFISLNGLGLNGLLLSVLFFAITWDKVCRALRTVLQIFDHFSAANIGCQSGQMNILKHVPASVCS